MTAVAMARFAGARVEKLRRLANMLRYRSAALRGTQPQTFGVMEPGSIAVECNRSRSSNSAIPFTSEFRAR